MFYPVVEEAAHAAEQAQRGQGYLLHLYHGRNPRGHHHLWSKGELKGELQCLQSWKSKFGRNFSDFAKHKIEI